MTTNEIRHVYTDGACKGNPGKGGWGWVEYSTTAKNTIEFNDCGGSKNTTNNKMELTAIIEFLKGATVSDSYIIHSDSQYCLKGLLSGGKGKMTINSKQKGKPYYTGWMKGWIARNFKNVKNVPLWKALDKQIRKHLYKNTQLEFRYVKGHSGDIGNDRADELANLGVPK